MTTKKHRREQVALRRAQYDAETKRLGLVAQKKDRERRDRREQNKEAESQAEDSVQFH